MSGRARFVVLVVVLCSVAAVMTAYAVGAAAGRQRRQAEAVAVTAATAERTDSIWAGPRIVFRHTGLDGGYGRVAAVALDDPAGPRSLSRVTCDRVAAVAGARGAVTSCLRIERAGPPAYTQTLYDGAWRPLQSVALPGIPSRTRLSPDGSLVAATTFVDHHDYEQVGFSTATVVRDVGGASLGNLES